MKREKQKYIIILMITMLSLTYGIKYINKNKYEELPEVKLKEITDSKAFAIMVQNGDTYEEYTIEDNKWPGSDYVYKEAKCTDNNGTLVEDAVTFADGKATLTTDKTIYCTLYFDERPKTTTEILREKDKQGYLSEELQGGMYRYQAAPADAKVAAQMTNWICFGTKSKDECTNTNIGIYKYMYRIIGITNEGQMYIIKETFLKEGSGTSFTWNDKYSVDSSSSYYCNNGSCPEWNTSLLFKRINGISNGTIPGTGTTSNNANTDIFVDSSEYDYLKSGDSNSGGEASEWYNLIADHEWMYGDIITEYNDTALYTSGTMYAIETGNAETTHYVGTKDNIFQENYTWNKETDKVKAKISLMYIHDYVYSYYDGLTEESRGNPKNYSIVKNSWLFFQKDGYNTSPSYEWLSTRWGVFSTSITNVYARYVYNYGDVNYTGLHNAYGVRPVFYLSSIAKIASGDGTKANPYLLDVQA